MMPNQPKDRDYRYTLLETVIMATVIAMLDYITKLWIVDQIIPTPVIINDFINIVSVRNRGVSFGLFADYAVLSWVWICLAIGVAGILIHWTRAMTMGQQIAAIAVAAGAIGNALDRIRYGAVVDFIDIHWHDWHWPAFNIADGCITVGAIYLGLEIFRGRWTL